MLLRIERPVGDVDMRTHTRPPADLTSSWAPTSPMSRILAKTASFPEGLLCQERTNAHLHMWGYCWAVDIYGSPGHRTHCW